MAEYEMQELNLPNEEGKRVLFPRMRLWGQTDLKAIAEKVSYASSFTPGDIIGLMTALSKEIAYEVAQGRSVKIEGLGVFSPSLSLREGVERETGEAGDRQRNASSIRLSNINFKADKEFVREAAGNCRLERSKYKFRRSSQLYSPQERLQLAREYLQKNGFMTVADYCRLTGLLRDAAARELKRWHSMPEAGITFKGRGTHKVYILR